HAVAQNQVLRLRVPAWCENPLLSVNGKAVKIVVEGGNIVLRNKWKQGDKIELTLPMTPEFVFANEHFASFEGKEAPRWGMMAPRRSNYTLDGFIDGGRCAWVNYGPLLCAMSMQRANRDYFDNNEELWTEFRYALTPKSLDNCKVDTTAVKHPFMWHYQNAPLSISTKANLVDWQPDKGNPVLPITAPATLESDIDIKLIPYGFLAYRIAMFPLVGE
ncbi:MAG: hypothetical protein ACI4TS_07280, partial [Bacteroidaceae bacterium]